MTESRSLESIRDSDGPGDGRRRTFVLDLGLSYQLFPALRKRTERTETVQI